MNRMEQIYRITLELESVLTEPITSKNRESIIEKINQLIEKRGEDMKQISPPFSNEEKEYGAKVVELNQTIQKKMNTIFTDLKQEMKQMKKQKKSNRSYTNPYQNVQTVDGMFLDQKK